jgi:predicted DNA-binding transcriptional regulator YafY
MDKPLQRVLAALELLQSHPSLSGAQLAELLGVERRTVRRYIVELEKFGVPIRATRGRDGHYALMPGYKLPPMVFSNDETLALSMGLRVARELGLSDMAPAVASAQAKLDRVMPAKLRRRLGDLNAVVALDLSRPQVESGSEFFATATQCASAAQRVRLAYRALDGRDSEREFNPYGVGYLYGAWYVVGYCHLRQDLRSFRLDRVQALEPLPKTFAMPVGFDAVKYLRESIASVQRAHTVVVRFPGADMARVRRAIPSSIGKLKAERDGHVRLDAQADELNWFARELSRLDFAFEIVEPVELKVVLAQHLRQLLRAHASVED